MRYDTHAARIAQGVPLFMTLSPDEKHNLLMIRMCRARRKDPALNAPQKDRKTHLKKPNSAFYALTEPPVDVDMETLSLEELHHLVPDHDTRRAMISQDALASVDGFRTIVLLFLEHVLGLRICPDCPNCLCSDLFGSNASPEGGILGRVDGIYGSIEAQKSAGSLHVHVQVFVQCLHQHVPLQRLLRSYKQNVIALKDEYAKYKRH
eukprot:6139255-Karenia_brevis.AAC.1